MEDRNQIRNQIRKQYRKKRAAMPPELAEQLSLQISEAVLQWEIYRRAEFIFFYYPLGNEVSLLPVVKKALREGKHAAFPKTEGSSMQFYEVTDLKELSEGSFHVMEPLTEDRQPVKWEPDVCFVPGVVFDRTGGRFGYGKGFYDRYFAKNRCRNLAGCAYECQIADRLSIDTWDIRMDYLVSESGITVIYA